MDLPSPGIPPGAAGTATGNVHRDELALSAAILASSRDCIVVLDLDGNNKYVSQGGIEAMEVLDVDAIIGLSWLRVWDGEDNAAARAAVAAAREGGIGRFRGFCATHKGTPKWWDCVISPLPGADGRPRALVSIARDVTEQHRAETMLRETEERRRQAVEAADIGTWAFDVVTRVMHCDARVKILSGLSEDAEEDLSVYLASLHPDDREWVIATGVKALDPSGPGTCQAEYRVIGVRDRVERWLSVTAKARFEDGKPVRLVGTARDVTVRKCAEERAKLLSDELQHRVKNTLSVVQAIVGQTLRKAETLEEAQAAIYPRIAALAGANDILTREGWKGSDLREAAQAALLAHDDGTSGRFRLNGPAVWLPADATMSFSLMLNELATNATKYGALSVPEGHVELVWELAAPSAPKSPDNLTVVWRERGGPLVRQPSSRGFGSKLIEAGLSGGLRGKATLAYPKEGVTCTVHASVG